MGVSDTGGFINSKFEYETDIRGLYDSEKRRLRVVNIDKLRSCTYRVNAEKTNKAYKKVTIDENCTDAL